MDRNSTALWSQAGRTIHPIKYQHPHRNTNEKGRKEKAYITLPLCTRSLSAVQGTPRILSTGKLLPTGAHPRTRWADRTTSRHRPQYCRTSRVAPSPVPPPRASVITETSCKTPHGNTVEVPRSNQRNHTIAYCSLQRPLGRAGPPQKNRKTNDSHRCFIFFLATLSRGLVWTCTANSKGGVEVALF